MVDHKDLASADQDALDAAAFRRLLAHLGDRTDVQNIDLMILADFCRNCLSRWYQEAATEAGLEISTDEARARVYGMPYGDWKDRYQTEATPQQMAAFETRNGGNGDQTP